MIFNDAWYPFLNYPYVAHGFGTCLLTNVVTGEQRQIGAGVRTQPAGWLDQDTLVYYTGESPAEIRALNLRTDELTHLETRHVNRVQARNGHWITGYAATGTVSVDGVPQGKNLGWRVSIDGRWSAVTTNTGLRVFGPDGRHYFLPNADLMATLVDPIVREGAVGIGYNGPVAVYEPYLQKQTDVTVSPWRKEHAPVVVGEWIWTVSQKSDAEYFVLGRPCGDPTCIVIPSPKAVMLDVQQVGERWVIVTCSDTGEGHVYEVAVTHPRIPLDGNNPVPPIPPIPPMPTPNHLDTVRNVRDKYPTTEDLGTERAWKITNEVAWIHRAEGFGLRKKLVGNNWDGYAVDIVFHQPSNQFVDVLGSSETVGTPQWSEVPGADPKEWMPPLDPGTVDPPDPPDETLEARVAALERDLVSLRGALEGWIDGR